MSRSATQRMGRPGLLRKTGLHWAAVLQRLSGVVLALFLPVHFWVLQLALQGDDALDVFLTWADAPLVKIGEAILVTVLSAHLVGGLRILMIELLPWREGQKTFAAVGLGVAFGCGLLFLLSAFL